MTEQTTTAAADSAITESVLTDSIIYVPAECADDILAACDDSADLPDGRMEAWGTTADGAAWRVVVGRE